MNLRILYLSFLVLLGCPPRDPLLHSERTVHFSSSESMDTFKIIAFGSDTLHASVSFLILSNSGDTLWHETFAAVELVGYGLMNTADHRVTEAEQNSYIASRIERFFDDSHLLRPAISPTDEFSGKSSQRDVWNDIRSDTIAVGFHYLIGEENNRCIAYSKKSSRVVVYKSFD